MKNLAFLCLAAVSLVAQQQSGPTRRNLEEAAAAARLLPAPKAVTIAFTVDGVTETIDLSKIPGATEAIKNRLVATGQVKIADCSTPAACAAAESLAMRQEYVSFLGQTLLNPIFQSKAEADAAAATKKKADADAKAKADAMQKVLNPPKQ